MKPERLAGGATKKGISRFPLLEKVMAMDPVFWTNTDYLRFTPSLEENLSVSRRAVNDAVKDVKAFSGYIEKRFSQTAPARGIIESDLTPVDSMKKTMETFWDQKISGRLYLKKDSHLAVAGSIKARGGFYDVLKHAQNLAVENGLLVAGQDISLFSSKQCKDLFSEYAIGVGSTGNLGLSIGIMGQSLGFKVYVHMSADAKQWKKEKLTAMGVTVIEHDSDYTEAVEYGRKQADNDPRIYFVDDENSRNLFLGYAVAGQRLKAQLKHLKIPVNKAHPLFVYLPCGVGGAAGGITLGLKQIFKDNVHCFFAEPTHSPSVLLGLMTGAHDKICVQDFGIDNRTAADGLAVGRPSRFVGKLIAHILSGVYTLADEDLYRLLAMLKESEGLYMEPSALASMAGPVRLFQESEGLKYLTQQGLTSVMNQATHVVWGTGGSMVPKEIQQTDIDRGKHLLTLPGR